MHQYKTIAQTLLVLSILNVVFSAPVVPQEARDTGNDVIVVADDVTTMSERRRGTPGGPGTTPSQYSSPLSDGSPPHGPLPLEESALLQGSAPSSGPAPLSHLSATDRDGQVPVHDSTTEASTSAHPLSAADAPAPAPVSNTEASTSAHTLPAVNGPAPAPVSNTEASTTPHYDAITPDMLHKDPHAMSLKQKIAGFSIIAVVATGIVLLTALNNNHDNHNHTVTGG